MRQLEYLLVFSLVAFAATCCDGLKNPIGKIKKAVLGGSDQGKETVKMTPEEKADFEAFMRFKKMDQSAPSQQVPQQPSRDEPLRLEYHSGSDLAVQKGQSMWDTPTWSAQNSIVPFDPSKVAPERPKNYIMHEKEPQLELSEAGLSLVAKELFVWKDKLAFDDVVIRLEQLLPSYDRVKNLLPLDTRELLSFSQDISAHCQDQKFYQRMARTMARVEKEFRPLENYLKECIANYQFTCQSDLTLTDQVTEFRRTHGAGLNLLEILKRRMAENKGIYQHYQLGVYSLGQVKDNYEWGGERGNALFIDTCNKIGAFRDRNHLERMDPAWRHDENIAIFMSYVELCRDLERENYKMYLNN